MKTKQELVKEINSLLKQIHKEQERIDKQNELYLNGLSPWNPFRICLDRLKFKKEILEEVLEVE